MSATNFMDLNGSGSSSDMSNAMVTTIPTHVSTSVFYHSHHRHNSSEDEETVAIVLACVIISLIIGWFGSWVYRMAREKRQRLADAAADMVEDAVVTVEDSRFAADAPSAKGTEGTEGAETASPDSTANAENAASTEGAEGAEGAETASPASTANAENTSHAEVTDV